MPRHKSPERGFYDWNVLDLTYVIYYVTLKFRRGGDDLITIVIKKRGDGFVAFLQDDTSAVGRGSTSDAAVGDLVRSHTDRFNVMVVAPHEAPVSARVPASPGLIRT